MRILSISYEYPPVGGGGGDAVLYIARELARKGHAVRVLTAHCSGLPLSEKVDGFEIRRIRAFRRRPGGCSIPEMFAFMSLACIHGIPEVARFKPDLVHIHHAVPDGPIGYWLQMLHGKPYVMTAQGGDVPGFIPALDGFFQKIHWACDRIWRKAAVNVAVGEHLAGLATKAYPKARVLYIPNGVDTEMFCPPSAPPQNKDVQILFAGRFHWQKNIPMLIEAIPRIQRITKTPFRVTLCGSGPEREALLKLTEELGAKNLVDFPGWQTRPEMAQQLQRSDIFCLPSRIEGMPLSCIQAMACGLPVAGTDVPGTQDEVVDGETGFLVPSENSDALAKALAQLIDSPEMRRKMGMAGRQRCEALFSWKVIGDQYERLFLEILSGKDSV